MAPKLGLGSSQLLFLALFAFRVINTQFVQTFFQPDEFFQSLEPAWRWTFGSQSGAWITWEWRAQLRASIHPLLFASGYKTVDQLVTLLRAGQHFRMSALHATPRLIQAFFAAATDFFTWSLARQVYGKKSAYSTAALALTVISPWQWFCSVRTFSNSLETTLTVLGLALFPWSWFNMRGPTSDKTSSPNRLGHALLCAAVACILRPTNVLVWFAVSASITWRCGISQKLWVLASRALACGITVLITSAGIDRAFYNVWTFPPLKFLYFNVIQSLAGFYGLNRLDYYFTEGIPLLLTTSLPFAVIGIWRSIDFGATRAGSNDENGKPILRLLSLAVLSSVITLSSISHKEVRFIYPLLPMLHILAAKPAVQFFWSSKHLLKFKMFLLICGIVLNILIAGYVSLIHQRGVMDVMEYLRHRQEARMAAAFREDLPLMTVTNVSVGFLMPCHSTPWRSHLIYPEINAWALTCEPPIDKTAQERKTYLDEADAFYADPTAWLKANMEDVTNISSEIESKSFVQAHQRPWPEYLIFFDQLLPVMRSVLIDTRYKHCMRLFNSHWHDDWRRRGDVMVWCMRSDEALPSRES